MALTEAHDQRGMLILTVKAQRGGRVAVFVLRGDAAHPGRFAQAGMVPMDDPALYADQTRFHIGSMDKMFTAVAIAQLVEADKLSWQDTLAQRVPEADLLAAEDAKP